jgi:hypothetical protein
MSEVCFTFALNYLTNQTPNKMRDTVYRLCRNTVDDYGNLKYIRLSEHETRESAEAELKTIVENELKALSKNKKNSQLIKDLNENVLTYKLANGKRKNYQIELFFIVEF